MSRISISDDKAESIKENLKNLDKKSDKGRENTNTEVLERGIEVESFIQEFKEEICEMSNELLDDMKEYREKIEEEYDCNVSTPQRAHVNVEKHGNEYDYRLGEQAIKMVNGKSLQTKHCPECNSQNNSTISADSKEEILNFEVTDNVEEVIEEREEKMSKEDYDGYIPSLTFNQCPDCVLVFDTDDRVFRDRVDSEKVEEAEEIGRVYRNAFTEGWSAIVDYIESVIGEGRGEWVTEYGYQYQSGLIIVDIPSMPKKPSSIDIRIDNDQVYSPVRPYNSNVRMYKGFNSDAEDYRTDYKKLLDEIATLNGCKVEILGYRLNWEIPEVLVLKPNPPAYMDDEDVGALSGVVLPVDGQGYTVEQVDEGRVRELINSEYDEDLDREKMDSRLSDFEKDVFVEIQEEVETNKS